MMADGTRVPELNGYDNLQLLGLGGMAQVYRANQTRLGRAVAIKELLPNFADDEDIVARFEREARHAAALRHEGIVHVYDFLHERNTYYLVMEFVNGVDLQWILERVPVLPPEIAAAISLRLIAALAHAHHRGIIHRDVKPSNILISTHGEVKLTDFGIAKDPTKPEENLTQVGMALGTPAYMSPEQVVGEAVDFRSDLFSWAIVFYEMLCGARPFDGAHDGAIMDAIHHGRYPDIRSRNRNVPRPLRSIVRACLQRNARKRPPSTEMVRVALDKFVTKSYTSELDDLIAGFLLRAGLLEKGARGTRTTPSSEQPTFIAASGSYTAPPNASVILRMANYSREHKGWAAALITPALLAWPGSANRDHADPGALPPTLEVVRTSVEASLQVGARADEPEKDTEITPRKIRKPKKRLR